MATPWKTDYSPGGKQTYVGGGVGASTKRDGTPVAARNYTERTAAQKAQAASNVSSVNLAERAMAAKGASSYTPKLTPTALAKGASSFTDPAAIKATELANQYNQYNQYNQNQDEDEQRAAILTPDMSQAQQLEAMYRHVYGPNPTNGGLTFNSVSPDGRSVVVNQQNGSTSLINAKNVYDSFLAKVKGEALDKFVQSGGTLTGRSDTPIAYTDTYGFEHYTYDPGNVAMVRAYADALQGAGMPHGSDFSPNAGKAYAMSGVPQGYDIRGGYLYNSADQRVNTGLPGSVDYGNASAAGGTAALSGVGMSEITPDQMRAMLAKSATDRFLGMNGQYANINNWTNPYVDVRALAGQQSQAPGGAVAGGPAVAEFKGITTAPQGDIYQARIQNPDGTPGTGFIINGQTFYDQAGTQRVAPGTLVEARDGRVFTMKGGDVAAAYDPPQMTTSMTDFSTFLAQMGMGGGGMGMPDASQYQPKSYDEYVSMVERQLAPLYDQKLNQTLQAVDADSARRGFFGQGAWAGQRQETAALVAAEKAGQVGQMAQALWGMDAQQAQQALQNAWQAYQAQQQNQQGLYDMWLASQAAAKEDERYSQEWALKMQQAQQEAAYDNAYLQYLMGNQAINQQKADYTTNKPYYKPVTKPKTTTTKTTTDTKKTSQDDYFSY